MILITQLYEKTDLPASLMDDSNFTRWIWWSTIPLILRNSPSETIIYRPIYIITS